MVGILSPFLLGHFGLLSGALAVSFRECSKMFYLQLGVSKNSGIPKWMVKIMVPNPIKMDDLEVLPLFGGSSYTHSANGP